MFTVTIVAETAEAFDEAIEHLRLDRESEVRSSSRPRFNGWSMWYEHPDPTS